MTTSRAAAVAFGGALGAAITYLTQTQAEAPSGGPAGLPTVTVVLIALGSLAMGILLGLLRERTPGIVTAVTVGLLCGLTPLACYAAVGLTVRSGSGSAIFLLGTPLAALSAGIVGLALGSAIERGRATA